LNIVTETVDKDQRLQAQTPRNSHTDHTVTVTDYLYLSIQISNVHSPIAIPGPPLLPVQHFPNTKSRRNVHASPDSSEPQNPAAIKQNICRAVVARYLQAGIFMLARGTAQASSKIIMIIQ
jgi:hypothetical protein